MEGLKKILEENRARVVLFASDHFIGSRSTAGLFGIRVVSDLLKRKKNAPIIGVCGRLATTAGAHLFDVVKGLDFIGIGEVDNIIVDVISDLLRNGLSSGHRYESILMRSSSGSAETSTVKAARVEDLDELPLPAFHLLQRAIETYERVLKGPSSVIPFSIRTSQGCCFQCKFCAGVPNWHKYRTKTATRVGKEIDHLFTSLGNLARLSFFEDEIFTLYESHVGAIAEVLSKRNICLDGVYTHASLLKAATAQQLTSMTERIYLGLDNPDDRILKRMGKGQRLDSVLDAVDVARTHQLKVHLEWIIGAPDETVDSVLRSLYAIFNLLTSGTVDSINTYIFCPHPGTEYAENHGAYGLSIVEDFECVQESGGFPASETQRLSRNQVFSAYLMSQIVILETTKAREQLGVSTEVSPPNYEALTELFRRMETLDRS